MAGELDPLSQLIGTLSAQVQAIQGGLADLRAEILQNRVNSQTFRDEELRRLDLVQAEYRNFKHDLRGFEQSGVAIDERLRNLQNRLQTIENTLLVWKTRITVLVAGATGIGAIIGVLIEHGILYVVGKAIG
jgi:prefoldin subunit 5